MARSLAIFGKLDFQVSPSELSQVAYRIQSTGYPVTVPLAVFFKVFGWGLTQARIFMLLWMVVVLGFLFYFFKKISSEAEAVWILALLAVFAPFYGNGRTVIGEVPGLIFLLGGLLILFYRQSGFWCGLLLGLAVASKPSVYLAVIPAVLAVSFVSQPLKNFFRRSFFMLLGSLPAIILIPWLTMPDPFSFVDWKKWVGYFFSPYSVGVSPWVFVRQNLSSLPHTPTLIYFALILLSACLIYVYERRFADGFRKFFLFTIIYSFFEFVFYLRSPGYLRYLIAVEIFIFGLGVMTWRQFVFSLNKKKYFYWLMCFLLLFQTYHLFFRSKLYASPDELGVISYVENNTRQETIGVLNVPHLSALLPPERTYSLVHMYNIPNLGRNPLAYKPDLLIINAEGQPEVDNSLKNFGVSYRVLKNIGRYTVYRRE